MLPQLEHWIYGTLMIELLWMRRVILQIAFRSLRFLYNYAAPIIGLFVYVYGDYCVVTFLNKSFRMLIIL